MVARPSRPGRKKNDQTGRDGLATLSTKPPRQRCVQLQKQATALQKEQ